MHIADQLYRAAVWYLEEGTAEAREALAAAAARYESEGDVCVRLVREAVAERESLGGFVSGWHARAREALAD